MASRVRLTVLLDSILVLKKHHYMEPSGNALGAWCEKNNHFQGWQSPPNLYLINKEETVKA